MKLFSEAKMRQLRMEFPTGTRVELVSMDDPAACRHERHGEIG